MRTTNTSGEILIDGESNSIASTTDKIRALYHLTKPGITRMVVLTTTAGYFLAIPNFVTIQSLGGQILHFLFLSPKFSIRCITNAKFQ